AITSVTNATVDSKTVATVISTGAKISPGAGDFVKVASGAEANAPKNLVGPGEANADGNNIGIVGQPGQVVISEVKLSGATATDEFVEIYNKTNSTIDISGWKVTALAQDGTPTDLVTFAGSTTLLAGKFRLIAPTGTANVDNAYTPSGNGLDVNNTVILYRSAGPSFRSEDLVGCGTATIKEGTAFATCPVANTSLERKASPTSTATTLAAAGSEVTWGNSYDTNNNNFDFVTQTGAGVNPQHAGTTAEVPGGGGGGYQNQPPNINHMSVLQVISGSDFMIMAQMADPETPAQGLTANLIYSTDGGTTWLTLVGQYMTQDFKFIIPSAATGSGTGVAFKYYLKATDADANARCMWNMGFGACGTTDATARSGAWTVNSTSSAGMTNTIKGKVMSGATGIDNANVTLRGAGLNFNTTSATDVVAGTFTFINIPAGMFRLEANAPGYSMGWIDGALSKAAGTAVYGDNTINLTAGGGGGQGGDTTSPRVIWSAPMDGMNGAPTKINIPATGQFEA
ncbi:MAG: lamin tail domain-containing protein, partial [Kiritimatiellota bacterium]|nr:lamin tail domain-containing protein [Kiritimatiellota bacterium]